MRLANEGRGSWNLMRTVYGFSSRIQIHVFPPKGVARFHRLHTHLPIKQATCSLGSKASLQ